jgi:hypothetical protein
VVPNSSSAGNGNDGLVCPSQTHFATESCGHCGYVTATAMFFDATLPHPRHPETKWNIRSLIISKKHHNIEKKCWGFTHFIYLSIYLWLYSPFVGPWPLFQFLNPIHSW